MNIILDACAVIALFRGELGAEVVEQYLLNPEYSCSIHAVNLCEVYYEFLRVDGVEEAERVTQELIDIGVNIRSDLDDAFWRAIASYKATIRRISLADCFVLALANKLGGTVLTSDRKEFEPVMILNICPITFIR